MGAAGLDAPAPEYPARAVAYRAVALLMLAQILWSVDKHLMTLLFPAIQADLHISDTQIGLLQGFAYALCFSVAGLACGVAADRWNRRNLVIAGVAVWSVSTVLCGLAHSYAQLVAARMGVGVGEAVLLPTALSMLSDYFPPQQRGRAVGFFMTAAFLGGGGAYVLGGAIIAALGGTTTAVLPLLGTVALWKAAFCVVGAPGLLVAVVLFAVREPHRQMDAVAAHAGTAAAAQERSLWRYTLARPAAVLCVIFSYALLAYVSFGVVAWIPTLLVREFHLPLARVGLVVGLVTLVAGAAGSLCAGVVGDRWTAMRRRGAKFRLTLVWWVGVWPVLLVLSQAASAGLVIACYALFLFLNTFGYVSGAAVVQELVPARLRGRTTAWWYLASAVIGQGGGPLATALVTDRVFHSQAQLPYSLLVMATPAIIAGLLLSWRGLGPYDAARSALLREPSAPRPAGAAVSQQG